MSILISIWYKLMQLDNVLNFQFDEHLLTKTEQEFIWRKRLDERLRGGTQLLVWHNSKKILHLKISLKFSRREIWGLRLTERGSEM